MKRFSIGLLIGLLIGVILTIPMYSLAQQPIKLIINGQQIQCDVPPQNINGRILVPARFVAEPLGAMVEWDGVNKAVVINGEKKLSTIPIDSPAPKRETLSKQDSNEITSEQYQSFKNMFSIGEKIFHQNGGDLSCEAQYNGNLSENEFFKYWNGLDKNTKEILVKKLGAEIQSINPKIDIAIVLRYKDIKLGHVIAYSQNYQLCSFNENPQMKQSDIRQ